MAQDSSQLEQLLSNSSIDELAESGALGESVAQVYRNTQGLTRRKFINGLSAIFYGLAEQACSENKNPFVPCTSDCGDSGGTKAILTGRAVSVNNPDQGYNSGTAQTGNSMSNFTPEGEYRIENVNPGRMDLSLNGPDFIPRKVRANAQPGLNRFPPIDAIDKRIDDIDFDLRSFDEMCRKYTGDPKNAGVQDGTSIWAYTPEIIVDAESRNKMQYPGVYQGSLNDIKRYAAEFMPKLSDNRLVGVQVREIQRTFDVPTLPAEGKIIARFGKRNAPYPEGTDGDTASFDVWINANNNIYAADAIFTSDAVSAALFHELTHTIGFTNHPSRDGEYTIMSRHHGFEPTPWDFAHGKVLYRIRPGSKTPYDTSHLETLTGNVVAINEIAANRYIQLLKNIGLLPRNLGSRDLREYRAA